MADPRKKMRQMVSLKKKRYQDDEYDLDLAYITDRIIAFGFPAEGREAMFRNPMEDCIRFFDHKHKDKYYVYNLCIEKDRQYKSKKFHGRVAKYQFADHNAPPLEMIPAFCEHASKWLNEDPENIIAVHCKAGKGRTGVMISCLLMYMGDYPIAEEAMKFYGNARTHNGAGVTIPSQRRFINYYEKVLKEGLPAKHVASLLKNIVVENISNFDDIHFGISVESNFSLLLYKKKGDNGLSYYPGENHVVLDLGIVPVSGNTKITLYKPGKKKEPLCWFWFHCAYIEKELRVTKKQIDKAVGDKQDKIFSPDFSIVAHFEELGDAKDTLLVHSNSSITNASLPNNNNNNNNNNNSGDSNSNEQSQETDTEEEEESEEEKEITKMVKQEVDQMAANDQTLIAKEKKDKKDKKEKSKDKAKEKEESEDDKSDDEDGDEGEDPRKKNEKKSSLITINLPLFKKRPSHPKKANSKSNKKDLKNEED